MASINIRAYATDWTATAELNVQAIGDGWSIAGEYLALHIEAIDLMGKFAGSHPSQSDEATILLLCHGCNLFSESMAMIGRGMFDVSLHLVRALMDVQSLLYACASSSQMAGRYLSNDLRASEARLFIVQDRSQSDQELGKLIKSRFKAEADRANELSHVGVAHIANVFTMENEERVPTIWGIHEPDESIAQTRMNLYEENWLLTWLWGLRFEAVGAGWTNRYMATRERYREYLRANLELRDQ